MFLFFRCSLLWIHCQFCLRCTPLDELCQSLLVAILGRHSKSIQEHGTLGVLFLQISPSRLPIRSSFPWLPRPLWRRVPLDQREIITRMVDGRPALCHSGTHCLLPGTNGHCLLASSSAFGVDFALWMVLLWRGSGVQRSDRWLIRRLLYRVSQQVLDEKFQWKYQKFWNFHGQKSSSNWSEICTA